MRLGAHALANNRYGVSEAPLIVEAAFQLPSYQGMPLGIHCSVLAQAGFVPGALPVAW